MLRVDDGRAALTERLKERARELGFALVGVTDVRSSAHADFYRAWLERGLHGDMAYLAREDAVARRTRPDEAWPALRSAIVLAMPYADGREEAQRESRAQESGARESDARAGNASRDTEDPGPELGIVARYARGRDYHRVMKARVMELLRWLEGETGQRLEAARAYVDTGPVLERELGQRAGLGWFGCNTMLINPGLGSYFFLGALLVELELEPDAPFTADRCGTCTRCVEACPTGALLGRDANGAPVIDATRCISYLTIEQRGAIPVELRPLVGNRVFGCDICQEVCPFTRKFSAPTSEPSFAARGPNEPAFGVQLEPGAARSHPGTRSPLLVELLETALDAGAWDAFTRGSPIRRAGRAGLARNVCVGLGNWGSTEAVPVLTRALRDPDPVVRSHAAWALGQIGTAAARDAVRHSISLEDDAGARVEMMEALRLPE